MQINQFRWSPATGWPQVPSEVAQAHLVLVFAEAGYFQSAACYDDLRARFPVARIVGCSSSGSVMGAEITDGDVVATAVRLDRSRVRVATVDLSAEVDAAAAGGRLMAELTEPDLRHVFVLSDGLLVNGSALTDGLNRTGVPGTGGLAGDGSRFAKTWVMADGPATSGRIAAIGFYGDITVGAGCFAGWVEFGAERVVTRSVGNVVYEIDDQPALQLYKKYLGEFAAQLPASGLRFPLSVRPRGDGAPLIRTLLAVDEAAQSLTFAGDVPQGQLCKLMRTDLESLIASAGMAAQAARTDRGPDVPGLCLIVSCVGRRLVMGQLTEEELDIVRDTLGAGTHITGFYSYGELAPAGHAPSCSLHNQTMTMTTLYE